MSSRMYGSSRRRVGTASSASVVLLSACLFAVCLTSSCALFPKKHRPEPGMVMIVNNTGAVIQNVTAREARERTNEANRLLSVSNLPAGRYCSVIRKTGSKPLADRIVVSWDSSGRQWSVPADISGTLDAATGSPDEVLVIRILPSGNVVVNLALQGALEPGLRL